MISTSKTCEGAGEWLTDAELRRHEVKLAPPPRPAAFVPAFPLAVLQAVAQARAEKALALILAIHRQLQMSGREWTPLNAAVWQAAGNPKSKARTAILGKLKMVPEIILLTPERTSVSRYRVARGTLWRSL